MTDSYETASPEIASRIVMVDAEVATKMLQQHPRNRRLSTKRVGVLATHMRNGTWVFDGAPVRFDTEGSLVDGQHRLQAVIEADVEVPMLLVRGVPKSAITTMDTGKTRTFGDMLTMEDKSLTDVNTLAAVTKISFVWQAGGRGLMLRSSGGTSGMRAEFSDPSLVMEWFRANKDQLIEITREARKVAAARHGITTQAVGCCLWALREAPDQADVEHFFARLADGADLSIGSPILALRKKLDAAKGDKSARGANFQNDYAIAYVIKAWNLYQAGELKEQIVWRPGGSAPERFPEPTI